MKGTVPELLEGQLGGALGTDWVCNVKLAGITKREGGAEASS